MIRLSLSAAAFRGVARLGIVSVLGLVSVPCLAAEPPQDVASLVRVVQVSAEDRPLGTAQEMHCPANGCQIAATLQLSGTRTLTLSFQTVISFAGQGVYVMFETASAGTQIRQFGETRRAPVFLPRPASGQLMRIIPVIVEQQSGPRSSAQANMIRYLAPEAYIRIEFSAPIAAPTG
jgi:hypothetical protein